MANDIEHWQSIYHEAIQTAGYAVDAAQLPIVAEFARIESDLNQAKNSLKPVQSSGFFSRFFSPEPAERAVIKGLYLFGTVGRGKTFLMDLFCQHIAFSVKRYHYHHFMKSVHDELKQIKDQQNPLQMIAADFAANYQILCLDEFMVNDITDAMLLHGLLQGLIERGVVIVTTTNIPPDDLYKNGLQRSRFLPAIALIKSQFVLHEMADGQDFRRLCLAQHKRFFSPLNEQTQAELQQIANELSEHLHIQHQGIITINGRDIPFVLQSQAVIWFTFADICEGYRSQLDYIELAKHFHVMIVSDIPVLDEFHEEAARRFLLLVDELYDQRIDLILSSAVPIEQIYSGKKIHFEYLRLQSRLFEMQSTDYGK